MVLAQSVGVDIDLPDLQEIDKRLQQFEALKKIDESKTAAITELEKALDNANKTIELDKRELELNGRIIAIKDQQIAAQQQAFNDMKEVTDRALKLAETKKSNLFETWGPLAIIVIAAVTIAAVL